MARNFEIEETPRRIAVGRVFFTIIASGLVFLTIEGGLVCLQEHREIFDAIDARPTETPVDFSRRGAVTVPFHQTYYYSHGEHIYLNLKPMPVVDGDITSIFAGLDGTLSIRDTEGEEVRLIPLNEETIENAHYRSIEQNSILIGQFSPFSRGEYTMTINVLEGAPALECVEQQIHARYYLCGLEYQIAALPGLFALICGIPALTISVIVVKGFVRYGWYKPKKRVDSEFVSRGQ